MGEASDQFMQIRFVTPDRKDEPQPIDVTPHASSPYEGQPADLSRPAIEAPRPRQQTPYGIWERPKPTDWMG
jgi:hypothetical protein